jgi:hypothetical protein
MQKAQNAKTIIHKEVIHKKKTERMENWKYREN